MLQYLFSIGAGNARPVSITGSAKNKNIGRPKNEDQRQAFVAVCEYLESNDEEQITISELVSKMGEYLLDDDSVPYGSQYLKQKLKEHYND